MTRTAVLATMDMSDRVVLVTGAARGIGAEIAVEAARRGAHVAVGYRSSNESARAVVERVSATGGVAAAFQGDLGDADQAGSLVADVERRLGPIDGLVNTAAVMATSEFLDLTEADWRWMIRNDLYSVVFTCQSVLPGMLERARGSIVNFSSRLAAAGAAEAPHYAAAKAAVVSLTRSLAVAFGSDGIRVNAVSPGTTATDMGRDVIDSDAGLARRDRIPIRRFVSPREVAAAAVFLLTDASAGITGQTIHVNGGELTR